MLLHPVFNINSITPPFPYTFPLLSVRADTGTSADWTEAIGDMVPIGGVGPEWVLEDGGTFDRAYIYQTFSIGSSREAVVDAGNALVDVSHVVRVLSGDADAAVGFVEFYDGSSVFLGRIHTGTTFSATDVTMSKNNARVPPLTRSVRVGWLGSNISGNQLSAYVKDLACTIKEETSDTWDDVVLVVAERNANITGWTSTVGTMNVLAYPASLADWEWAITDVYSGGTVANTTAHKNYSFPAGWAAKVAAGNVNFLFRASIHNANQDDDVEISIRRNNGTTNPVVTSGLIEVGADITLVELTGTVPSDTTSIDIVLRFRRQDGTANDGAVEMISLLLYEQA